MIFRFLVLSDEIEDFRREIKIDANDTFLDLYQAILDCTGFSDKEMASFYICDEGWRKELEITLIEMDTYSDEDSYTMEECVLNDFLEDEKQKLMYVFDYINERALYIELAEIITGKNLDKPSCTMSSGNAPQQIKCIDDIQSDVTTSDLGESFFGDESYNMDEIDREGFEGLDDLPDIQEDIELF